MRSAIHSIAAALILGVIPGVMQAQTLVIRKDSGSNYWIEASAPANNPHTLQASVNMRLWIDLRDQVTSPYSLALTNATRSFRYFRLSPSQPPAEPIRIVLIGDSMVADCCGWGAGIYPYFKENATVLNYAAPWTSTKVFLKSEEYDRMMLVQPDYVFIMYGFIDGGTDPERSTTLEEFMANLQTIVGKVRSFGGVPVLISHHAPRLWDEQGQLVGGWEKQNAVAKRVAILDNAPFIDFNRITKELFFELGPAGTEFMRWAPDDFAHFSLLGAQYVSRYLVNELPPEFGPYLQNIFDAPVVP